MDEYTLGLLPVARSLERDLVLPRRQVLSLEAAVVVHEDRTPVRDLVRAVVDTMQR